MAAFSKSLVYGLAGGISSGKSVAGDYLSKYFDVHDADKLVHRLYAEDESLREQLVQAFGVQVVQNKVVDREWSRQLVFSDPLQLEKLNQVVRPAISRALATLIETLRHGTKPGLVMIPLLFENNWQEKLDYVLLIGCRQEQQINRCLQRGFSSTEQIHSIMSEQWPLERKMELADHCILNDGSLEQFFEKLDHWYHNL